MASHFSPKKQKISNHNFKAEVEVATNKMFYMWIFGFGGKVKIKGPEDIKQQYCEMLKEASENA